MSEPSRDPVAGSEPSAGDEPAYFQAIEEFFVSRRGDPLFLSSADWTLVHAWRTQGVPLRVVMRGIGDALDGHAHSWGRGRKVASLRYCAPAVEEARDRWERALGLGQELGLESALESVASALERATGLPPGLLPRARELARELRDRARRGVRPRDVEPWLAEREAELVASLAEHLEPARLAQLEARVDAGLAPYRGRMPERVLAQVRGDAIARRLLEVHGLPRLSVLLA